jgi:predicted Zn finger-like uncharacterized protein
MYTQCPGCRTIFKIDEEALQASLGIVHCGKCAQRFDALRSLSDTLPADTEATLGDGATEPQVLTLTNAVTSEGQEPGVQRKHRREKSPPAAADGTLSAAQASAELPPAEPATANSGAPNELEPDLTAALIADAAGLPANAPDQTGEGLSTHAAPVQAHFTQIDIIPLSPDDLAAIESGRRGPPRHRNTASAHDNDADHDALEPPAAAKATPGSAATAHAGENPQLSLAVPGDAVIDRTGNADPGATNETPHDTTSAPGAGDLADAALADPHGPVPVYVRPRAHWYAHASLWWTFACLLLVLTLAAQLAWNERATLFRNPQTRPWVAQICRNLPCHLPLIRDVSKLELVSRDIRPDPATAGALLITATLRNDAAFRQPWPLVVVELSDIDGNPVAMRRFRPAEYMPDPARRTAGITPGATVAVAFEVADPGKRAVNFQFSFE